MIFDYIANGKDPLTNQTKKQGIQNRTNTNTPEQDLFFQFKLKKNEL